MSKIIRYTISILLLIAIQGCSQNKITAVVPEGIEYFVSTKGNDVNSGTRNKPLASLEEARDRARELPANTPVNITVEEGTYYVPHGFVLTDEDSGSEGAPVVYEARAANTVSLKGSMPVTAKWELWRDGIYRCKLKGTSLEGKSFNQLFLNNDRMVRARYPNWDYENPLRSGKGYLPCAWGKLLSMGWKKGALDEKHKTWSHTEDAILHVFHKNNWGNMQYRIANIDGSERRIDFGTGGMQCQQRMGPGLKHGHGSPFYIENIFEELDAPGEWFLDKDTAVLYFMPPTGLDPNKALVEAPVAKRLIELVGSKDKPVKHVTFRGFHVTQTQATFMDSYEDMCRGDWAVHRGGAIYAIGTEDCAIEDCHVEQVGGNGIFVDGYNRRFLTSGCLVENTGESAVCFVGNPDAVREWQSWTKSYLNQNPRGSIEGPNKRRGHKYVKDMTDLEAGPKTEDYPADCAVRNSILRDVGIYGKQTSGVFVSMSMDITISHCSIYNIPRAGVTFNDGTWGGHILEHCDIWETVQETGEHGPFNGWGRDRFWPDMNKDVVLLDAIKTVHIRNNRIANYRKSLSAGNWTIDLDDGCSNYHIYNNLSLGSTLKLRDGFYRKVWNNIHVSAVPLGWHVWPEDSGDEFMRNITVVSGATPGSKEKTPYMIRPANMPEKMPWGKHESNLWWNVNSRNFQLSRNEINSFEEWKEKGFGEGSVFADPMFVDPVNGNFKVSENSPALKLGFINFPMDQFGHQMTQIEPKVGEFTETQKVSLKADLRGGSVYYTLDGTEPSPSSILYKGPFLVSDSCTVSALTFKNGKAVGFPARAVFNKVSEVRHPSWLSTLLSGKMSLDDFQKKENTFIWQGGKFVPIAEDPDLIDAAGGVDSGMYLLGLTSGSSVANAGLRKGDIIISINRVAVNNAEDLLAILKEFSGKTVTVTYSRLTVTDSLKLKIM